MCDIYLLNHHMNYNKIMLLIMFLGSSANLRLQYQNTIITVQSKDDGQDAKNDIDCRYFILLFLIFSVRH